MIIVATKHVVQVLDISTDESFCVKKCNAGAVEPIDMEKFAIFDYNRSAIDVYLANSQDIRVATYPIPVLLNDDNYCSMCVRKAHICILVNESLRVVDMDTSTISFSLENVKSFSMSDRYLVVITTMSPLLTLCYKYYETHGFTCEKASPDVTDAQRACHETVLCENKDGAWLESIHHGKIKIPRSRDAHLVVTTELSDSLLYLHLVTLPRGFSYGYQIKTSYLFDTRKGKVVPCASYGSQLYSLNIKEIRPRNTPYLRLLLRSSSFSDVDLCFQ